MLFTRTNIVVQIAPFAVFILLSVRLGQDADVCVAAGIRETTAQLIKLYHLNGKTKTGMSKLDAEEIAQHCQIMMDVDFVGGDISQHGK